MAVQELFPGTQVTIGPVIEHGFYYDFSRKEPFTEDDLLKIEKRMKEIVDRDEITKKEVWKRDDAISYYKNKGEIYKAEIIKSIPKNEDVSIYFHGQWNDLCRGPHLSSTRKIGKYFFGAKVISFKELKKIAKNVNLRNIIVAIPSLKKRKRILLIKKLLPLCNSISTLPEKSFYKEKKIEVEDIQKISLEEIFNRNFSKKNKISTSGFKNKNILITGGAGSIGFDICKQLLDANPNFLSLNIRANPCLYSESSLHIITPFPPAKPSAFNTIGSPISFLIS